MFYKELVKTGYTCWLNRWTYFMLFISFIVGTSGRTVLERNSPTLGVKFTLPWNITKYQIDLFPHNCLSLHRITEPQNVRVWKGPL